MDNYEKVTIKDKLMLKVTLFFCVMTMAGCAVGPDYHPYEAKVPLAWTGTTTPIERYISLFRACSLVDGV